MEKLKDYFKRYPLSREVYENGGVLFHTRGAADSYGRGDTKKYTRKEIEQSTVSNDQLTQDAVILKLKETTDLSAFPYEEMKVFVKVLGLKPESNSKENILKVLSDYKVSLKDE